MAAITAVYPPPVAGLPFLAVVILTTGVMDVTPFDTAEDAQAYIDVCDAGMLSDTRKEKATLDA